MLFCILLCIILVLWVGIILYKSELNHPFHLQSHKIDRNVVLQLFAPLVTSHRVMSDQFKNGYNFICCEDETTLVFHEVLEILIYVNKFLLQVVKYAHYVMHTCHVYILLLIKIFSSLKQEFICPNT